MPLRPWQRVVIAMFAVAWGANQFSPMLVVYRDELGLTARTLALLFALYAVGLIPGLLLGGAASDRRGRRPVVLPLVALSPVATLLLILFRDDPVGLGSRGRLRDPREHEPVAPELAELVGQPVEARLDRLEPRMTARDDEPEVVEERPQRTSVTPEEVVRLDSLVPDLGDRAQRPLEVARARVAHRVEGEPEPSAHPGVPSRRT